MMPAFFAIFIAAPISVTNTIFEKQRLSLLWQSGLLLSTLPVFYIARCFQLKTTEFLKLYSAAYVMLYLVLLLIAYMIARGKKAVTTKEKTERA